MDARIQQAAINERAVARMHLQWQLDRLRLFVGLVEVVPPNRDDPILRKLRRSKRQKPIDTSVRFLPLFDGTGLLVRDRAQGQR